VREERGFGNRSRRMPKQFTIMTRGTSKLARSSVGMVCEQHCVSILAGGWHPLMQSQRRALLRVESGVPWSVRLSLAWLACHQPHWHWKCENSKNCHMTLGSPNSPRILDFSIGIGSPPSSALRKPPRQSPNDDTVSNPVFSQGQLLVLSFNVAREIQ
jgi:hypothetical protein